MHVECLVESALVPLIATHVLQERFPTMNVAPFVNLGQALVDLESRVPPCEIVVLLVCRFPVEMPKVLLKGLGDSSVCVILGLGFPTVPFARLFRRLYGQRDKLNALPLVIPLKRHFELTKASDLLGNLHERLKGKSKPPVKQVEDPQKYHNKAERRFHDSSDPLDSLITFLRDYPKVLPQSSEEIADVITQSTEEDMFRQAQLTAANLDTTLEPLQLPQDQGMVESYKSMVSRRIEANRSMIKDVYPTVKDCTQYLIMLPMRGLQVEPNRSGAVMVEMWHQWVRRIAVILPTANLQDFIANNLHFEYSGETINSAALWCKDGEFMRTKFAQRLCSWLLTRNPLVHNPQAVLIQYGVMVFRVLNCPKLSEYDLGILRDLHRRTRDLANEDFQAYTSVVASKSFRMALVTVWNHLECGGLCKFVMGLWMAVMSSMATTCLEEIRGAFLVELYARSKRKNLISEWIQDTLDPMELLGLHSNRDTCVEMYPLPTKEFKGTFWGMGVASVSRMFDNLAILTPRDSMRALTPRDIMGILAEAQHSTRASRATAWDCPPALDRIPTLELDTLRDAYDRVYRKVHSTLETCVADCELHIHNGLFTNACAAKGCPFYGKCLGPPQGDSKIQELMDHIGYETLAL